MWQEINSLKRSERSRVCGGEEEEEMPLLPLPPKIPILLLLADVFGADLRCGEQAEERCAVPPRR